MRMNCFDRRTLMVLSLTLSSGFSKSSAIVRPAEPALSWITLRLESSNLSQPCAKDFSPRKNWSGSQLAESPRHTPGGGATPQAFNRDLDLGEI